MRRPPGWVFLLGGVAAYDIWALLMRKPTLSNEFLGAVQHPNSRRKWLIIGAWAYLTAHLFGLVPRRADPLVLAAGGLTRVVRR